jgi:hypothetical protein
MTRRLSHERLAAAWERIASLRESQDAWELECAYAELTEARAAAKRWSVHGNRREKRATLE